MYDTSMRNILNLVSVLFFLSVIFLIYPFLSPAFAQVAISNCVITKIGNPAISPSLPPECASAAVECAGKTGALCAFNFMVGPNDFCCKFTGRFPPLHEGVDLIVKANTPIKVLEDGVVVRTAGGCGGNHYKIKDNNNRYHLGLHMIRPSTWRAGQLIKRGDIIGYVGHTGCYTSPTDHLHFQISAPMNSEPHSGDWKNPETILANWPNY